MTRHNPADVFPPSRASAHATGVRGDARLLVSGLNGDEADGTTLPDAFDALAELIGKHRRTYLAHPADDEARVRMRLRHLGAHLVALTVVCCRLLESRWRLEMEAVAASAFHSE